LFFCEHLQNGSSISIGSKMSYFLCIFQNFQIKFLKILKFVSTSVCLFFYILYFDFLINLITVLFYEHKQEVNKLLIV
jgi:hypothetical protein